MKGRAVSRTEKTKQQRMDRVWRMVCYAGGISEREIAEQMNISQRTINNYLNELANMGRIEKEGTLWFSTGMQAERLRSVKVSPEQAMTLYLAARLLVQQTDKRNEAAETALYKLADALQEEIGVGDDIRQAAAELAQRHDDTQYSQVFNTVIQGYLQRRIIDLRYAPRRGRPFRTRFAPYLLEPSSAGFTIYAIGHSELQGARRSYKLERIEEATLTNEIYYVPSDFPGLEILRNSWSIMLGDDLVEVVLRFHPSVVDRVKETRWHPSEMLQPDPEKYGWLRWSAQVPDTTDMLPWIRGWGADVEVLAPAALREQLAGEAKRLTRLYHTNDDDNSERRKLFR